MVPRFMIPGDGSKMLEHVGTCWNDFRQIWLWIINISSFYFQNLSNILQKHAFLFDDEYHGISIFQHLRAILPGTTPEWELRFCAPRS